MKKKQSIAIILILVLIGTMALPISYADDEGFSDVIQDEWYYDAVTALTELNVIEGNEDGSFGVNEPLSIAVFLKMLCGAAIPGWSEYTLPEGSSAKWSDVYYYAMLDRNLIRESEFDIEKLDEPVTRFEAALLISRVFEYILQEDSELLLDVNSSILDIADFPAKYVRSVQLCYSMGIFSGYDDGKFNGENHLTRAEGSVLVMRLISPAMRVTFEAQPVSVPVEPSPSPSTAPETTPTPSEKTSFVAEETVFIGDSLTHGLYLYGKMREPTYLYSTGMSVFKALTGEFETPSGKTFLLEEALSGKSFKAVYILLGINELGSNVTDYSDAYEKIIDKIKELLPDAEIYIQSLLPVSEAQDSSGGVFTIERINSFNKALKELAEDTEVNYVDINVLFADDDGFLPASSTWDGVHLNSKDYIAWADFLSGEEEDE